jgi:hypothetical protein
MTCGRIQCPANVSDSMSRAARDINNSVCKVEFALPILMKVKFSNKRNSRESVSPGQTGNDTADGFDSF